MRKRIAAAPDREPGQNAVEFALLLPLLLLVAFGILDLGRLFHAAITVTNAAREGARYGARFPDDTAGIFARVEAEGQNTWIDLSDATLATITTLCPGGCTAGTPLRVEITYTMQLILPGLFGVADVPVFSYAEMQVP